LVVRHPAVAGQFYESDERLLIKQIESCYLDNLGPGRLPELRNGPRRIKGGIAPHAGYMFSGMIAAHLYGRIAQDGLPETFIILGPNHTGRGTGMAITTEDFETPLGTVSVDPVLAKAIRKDLIDVDPEAHYFEHSIEVQLPFLQHLSKNIKIVPICMGFQDYEASKTVGEIIRDSAKGRDIVVIASTDFSHYVTKGTAKVKDSKALDAIMSMEPKKLYDVIRDENISMCGYGPVMAMMVASEAHKGKVLKYATSGDVRPMKDVVGYASAIFEK